MKTLKQIKNEYAVSKGFSDWWWLLNNCGYSKIIEHENEVMILAQKQALQNASEKADKQCWVALKNDIKNAITNENNIVR